MSVNDYDAGLQNFIEDFVGAGYVENPSDAHGVSQKVIHEGYNSLTPKQRTLYDAVVVPALKRRAEDLKAIAIGNSAAP